VYPLEHTAPLDAPRLRRFFQRGTASQSGYARVRPELRALVAFEQLNLLDGTWRIPDGLAAIFCRNVLIYFDRPTQARIVARFAPLLASDGLLFAGHSESLAYAQAQFRPCGHTVYDKRGARAA
jgi:chemotaxis protein methyltransferase CheR